MSTCPKCPAHGVPPTPRGWTFLLCPDHLLQSLAEVRQLLADSVASLERAAARADRVASDRAA
jgi:hypothetical protein